MKKITDDIIYIGVNDHGIDLFEGQYNVPNGMSYNSYVIIDERIAVFDTVDAHFGDEWIANLDEALAGRVPDYLIVQHMEPDHSANIMRFAKRYPDAIIVGNAKTFVMINQFFGTDFADRREVVTDGGKLSLGRHELTFVFAPMVHWPEVMVTYDAAHAHGVPLIIDNTFATPVNCRPFEWGADIVTHSTTKYMDGHGAAVGGCIVDSGRFDWTKYPDKYPGLCTPDESYHGVVYTERFGLGGAYITKATAQLMRDFGSIQSPQSAFLLNLGLESLHLRIKRHCENAQKVAEFLNSHGKVAWVKFAGLEGDKDYALAQKYLPNGVCGVVSFGVKGGRDAAETFMNHLKIAAIETHVADARSCCLHPASTTHRQMSDAELEAAGVSADLIRFSCGIENADDLIADIAQALDRI